MSATLRYRMTAAVVALIVATPPVAGQGPSTGSERWEPAIRKFEEADQQSRPPSDGILFVGSSSIVRWDVEKHFPGMPVIKRGFGGSTMADLNHFADRIVIPYQPRLVVVYEGDNDIGRGMKPADVADEFEAFFRKVRQAVPSARIVCISIKPSLRRWSMIDKMREANQLIRERAESDPRVEFMDVDAPMIGPDGRPIAELFVEDGLHMNQAGYDIWNRILKTYLAKSSD